MPENELSFLKMEKSLIYLLPIVHAHVRERENELLSESSSFRFI